MHRYYSLSVYAETASYLRSSVESNNVDSLWTRNFGVFIHGIRELNEIPNSTQQQVSEDLLTVLTSEILCNKDQIVIATAYCKTVSYLKQEPEEIFEHFLHLLKQKENQEWKIFLCHGILQLSCWKTSCKNRELLKEEILSIVQSLCVKLTSSCYSAFKVLNILLTKIHESYPDKGGISKQHFKAVLDIVFSNWENPLNGVRQQNSMIFTQLLSFEEDLWQDVLPKTTDSNKAFKHNCLIKLVLTELSWTMKSKYFLLTAIAQDSNVQHILSEHGEEIVAGLTSSLSIPSLVSAGTDLYLTILASLNLKEWQHWFLGPVISILSQEDLSLELENVFNYWMLQTLRKFPSDLQYVIETSTPVNLFAHLTLQVIARKEGLSYSNWEALDKCNLQEGLEDYSDKIRSQAFSLLCTSSKTSTLPHNEEFDLVQQFLSQNVNSDNAVLRQSLLSSFISFIIRIKDSILYALKNNDVNSFKSESDVPKSNCFSFLDWLHMFLLFNLEEECNYQRKITSLELYKIVLTYFGDQKVSGSNYLRKSNKDHLNLKAKENYFSWEYNFESESSKKALLKCVFDGDNNVRLCAANILMTYFQITDFNVAEFETLFKSGMSLCSDQMFYKAESGALITQVLVTLAYKSSSHSEFRNIINHGNDNFISVLLSLAEEQFYHLQEDLLKGASRGSFLYGTLQALELLLTDTSASKLKLNDDQQERLITLIEKVSDYLLTVLASKSDHSSGYAPSFGEMGMAIAAVVEKSAVKSSEVTVEVADDTFTDLQLTPAHQLVLSCVWLNLKECSKLCSILVSVHRSVINSRRCLSVVVSVLCRCRHKGAIESAGLALYHITSYLTKSKDSQLMNLPDELLRDFLQKLVGTTSATVSRRSAGLAILVHKLIAGDSRPRKPLLNICVSRLLEVAGDVNILDVEALVDLPQSQALHFLRTLVQESSLREYMAQYTLNISLVALTSLASPIWTIRNAALQLFGALLPKLVGQKPSQEQGKGNNYLAFEELYTQAKPLVDMMLKEFTCSASSNSMISHSKLMPLLTLVTNLTVGLQTVLTNGISQIVQQFQQCFKLLFKSSIFNVRKLSAKAHALFIRSSELVDMMNEMVAEVMAYLKGKDCHIKSENELHGFMLHISCLFERFEIEKTGMRVFLKKEQEVVDLLQSLSQHLLLAQCSYFTKSLSFELKFPKILIQNFSVPLGNSCKLSLGFSHFINKMLSSAILTMSENEIEEVVDFCLLKSLCHDVQYSCLKAVKLAVRSKNSLSSKTSWALLLLLKEFLLHRKYNTMLVSLILEIMVYIIEEVKLSSLEDNSQLCCPEFLSFCLVSLSSDQTSLPVLTFLLPVTSAVLSVQNPINMDAVLKVVTLIKTRTDPDFDQDIRVYAAKSLIFLVDVIKTGKIKPGKSGELIWEVCVDLLQDEATEVRFEATKFITVLVSQKTGVVWNPYISLEYIFKPECVNHFMLPEQALVGLWGKMLCESEKSTSGAEVFNPFDHGVKSIYAEDRVTSHLSYCCLLQMVNSKISIKEQVRQFCTEINEQRVSNRVLEYVQEIKKISGI